MKTATHNCFGQANNTIDPFGRGPAARRHRIVVGPRGLGRVAELLRRDPRLEACLVESTWDRVDAARAQVAAAGLDDRLAVHHFRALQFARAS